MSCCFFGHRDTPESIISTLEIVINELITNEKEQVFYVGNNGNFDYFVQNELCRRAKNNPLINVYIVLSYPNERVISGFDKYSIYPDGLEKTPKRFLISARNRWLLKKATTVVFYVKRRFSNAANLLAQAKKKGLRVINLSDSFV